MVLLAATLTAVVWANSHWRDGYVRLWATDITLVAGDFRLSHDLGHWVNDGLMTLFFLLVGLKLRREFDMGEFRERRRVQVPSSPRWAACSCRWPSSWPSRWLARRPVDGRW